MSDDVLIVADEAEDFEKCPTGLQRSICYFVEDIGTQEGNYKGKPLSKKQLIIGWELEARIKEGEYAGQPFAISKFYTQTINDMSNLCKDLESWRGKKFTVEEKKGFNMKVVVGVQCTLNIIAEEKDGKEIRVVAGVSPATPGKPLKIFNTDIPDWVKEMKKRSVEYRTAVAAQEQQAEADAFNVQQQEGPNQEVSTIPEPSPVVDDDLPF